MSYLAPTWTFSLYVLSVGLSKGMFMTADFLAIYVLLIPGLAVVVQAETKGKAGHRKGAILTPTTR